MLGLGRRPTIDALARIRAGDSEALDSLLREEWHGLVRFLRSRVDSWEAAQDAAQEAFVRLWEKREQWRSGSARAVLFSLAKNAAADWRRRVEVRRKGGEVLAETADRRVWSPAEELEASEARARFVAALRDLPEKRREVFELVRYGGLSYREVASALELSPQTVANHMSLALRDLRAALADVLPSTPDAKPRSSSTRTHDG